MAERASDGQVNLIFWQAPSIMNPYLSGGIKDIESASLILEPLARYNETGAMTLGWPPKSRPRKRRCGARFKVDHLAAQG